MQHSQHSFKSTLTSARVNIRGDATTVIGDASGSILGEDNLNLGAVARQGFIHRVVDHLINEVMESSRPGGADIHTRSFSNRLKAFKNLDLFGAIGRLYFRGFAHAIWIGQASCQGESTTGLPETLAEASETSFFQGVHPHPAPCLT